MQAVISQYAYNSDQSSHELIDSAIVDLFHTIICQAFSEANTQVEIYIRLIRRIK